jgi:cell division protease FtsH
MAKNLLLWLVIAAVLLSIFNNFSMQSPTERMVYSEFIQEIQRDQVRKVTIDGLTIYGERLTARASKPRARCSRIRS